MCKWIQIVHSTNIQLQPDVYRCSECSEEVTKKQSYCPFCGSDMREPEQPERPVERE